MKTSIILLISLLGTIITYGQHTTNIETCSTENLYINVDKMPVFKHDNMNAMEFIYSNITWPTNFDGQGAVVASFVVNKTGNICNILIIKSLYPDCDNEVRRVLSIMPAWQPGMIDNKPVDVTLYLPVFFRVD